MRLETGERFGRLVVVEQRPQPGRRAVYLCRCDCGEERLIESSRLRRGLRKSCGCTHPSLSHGEGGHRVRTPEYVAWASMIARCENARVINFARYGGRGIIVCARWRDSYEAFLADMGRRPSSEHSLDRKDPDGNYEPGNVRWATKSEQATNRRDRPRLEYGGLNLTASEWSRRVGVASATIRKRLARGWSVAASLGIAASTSTYQGGTR